MIIMLIEDVKNWTPSLNVSQYERHCDRSPENMLENVGEKLQSEKENDIRALTLS